MDFFAPRVVASWSAPAGNGCNIKAVGHTESAGSQFPGQLDDAEPVQVGHGS